MIDGQKSGRKWVSWSECKIRKVDVLSVDLISDKASKVENGCHANAKVSYSKSSSHPCMPFNLTVEEMPSLILRCGLLDLPVAISLLFYQYPRIALSLQWY